MAKSVIDYYETATAKCTNCNSVYTLGMTVESLEVEICGNCHPFYTGQETLIDTAGRIEKFKARLAKSEDTTSGEKKKKTKQRKAVQSLADLNLGEEKKKPVAKKEVKKAEPKTEVKPAKEEVKVEEEKVSKPAQEDSKKEEKSTEEAK